MITIARNTHCEAILDLEASETCGGQADTECGCRRDEDGNCVQTGQGGLCRDLPAAASACTYQCDVDNDCPLGRSCLGDPTSFCQEAPEKI